jgi:uncharacterized protein DUF4159
MIKRLAIAAAIATLGVAAAAAQDYWGFRTRRAPPRFATRESFDGRFNFCRLYFTQVRRTSSGQGWWTDYPDADTNFTIRLSELTRTPVSRQPGGEANYLVVRATDPELFSCPYLHIEDAGGSEFSDEEVAKLREYFLKGGFMWADDFWGDAEWEDWVTQLARVLDPKEFPIVDVPIGHPLFRTHFTVTRMPQIPSINRWARMGGATSELGEESAIVHTRAVFDRKGRIMVLMTHNTDISDAWEREAEDPRYFYQFSPDGYAVGINVLMYAMTH